MRVLAALLVLFSLYLIPALSQTCTGEYGASATCIAEATCVSGSVKYGTASGLCPGATNIKCCTNFLMSNAFEFYNPTTAPWQKTALDTLENRLTWFQQYRNFSCMFRGKTPDGTYCGGEDGMTEIKLSNVATYYNPTAAPHQKDALDYLQNVMVNSANLINDWLTFVKTFRNIGGGDFLPPAPSQANSQGSCTTPINGYQGTCIPVGQCTGGTFNGLCPGSSKCCVAETKRAKVTKEHISLSAFKALFEGISSTRAEAFWPYMNDALQDILKDNPSNTIKCHRVAAFAAQIGHESAGLLYFEEIASGADYEGRCSGLGNCQTGDGVRYKGRGPIQLTGRANYRNAGKSLNLDFEAKPEQVCFPSGGFKAATWFWTSNNLNRFCTGNYNDFTSLSIAINGGTNGLSDRRNRWARAKSLLGCPAASVDQSFFLASMGIDPTDPDPEALASLQSEVCDASESTSAAAGSVGISKGNLVVVVMMTIVALWLSW